MVEGGLFRRALVISGILVPALVLACTPSTGVTRNDLNCEGIAPNEQPADSLPPLEPVEAITLRKEGQFNQVILTTTESDLAALPPVGPYMQYRNIARVYHVGSETAGWSVQTQSVASREFVIPPQSGNVCVEVYRARVPKDHRFRLPPVRITQPRFIGLQGSIYQAR